MKSCGITDFSLISPLTMQSFGILKITVNRICTKTKVELLYKNDMVDTYELNVGIRTVELDASDSSESGIGDFLL